MNIFDFNSIANSQPHIIKSIKLMWANVYYIVRMINNKRHLIHCVKSMPITYHIRLRMKIEIIKGSTKLFLIPKQ